MSPNFLFCEEPVAAHAVVSIVERRVKRQNSVKSKNESAFHTRGKPRGLKTNHVRRESRGFGTKSTFYGLEGADLTKESASQYLVGKIPDLWKNVTMFRLGLTANV